MGLCEDVAVAGVVEGVEEARRARRSLCGRNLRGVW